MAINLNVYKIYQVRDKFYTSWVFQSIEGLTRDGRISASDIPELPRKAWAKIYEYVTEKEPSLDWIFEHFNRGHCEGWPPEDFEGHSMSVSDIIETPDGRLWFCDSFGWKEVRWKEAE